MKIRQCGGSQIKVNGQKFGGRVILTNKNLVFVPPQGQRKIVPLRIISGVESGHDRVILKTGESEQVSFEIVDGDEREWLQDIKKAVEQAGQRGESLEEEMRFSEEDLRAGFQSFSSSFVYLAGHPSYHDSFPTGLILKGDGLELTGANPPLVMPYRDIEGFEMIPSKQITFARSLLVGPLLASAWRTMEWFLSIRYRDAVGISLSLIFQPESPEILEEFVASLYSKLKSTRPLPTTHREM